MADARALLRAERASRRITHPHASYTSDGKLLCNLCETLVKSEAHWQGHLHSTQHNLRSQRQQDVAATKGAKADAGAKKRKAESIESPPQERKRPRAEPEAAAKDDPVREEQSVDDEPAKPTTTVNGGSKTTQPQSTGGDINPEDIEAFERELANLEADAAREEEAIRLLAVRNAATISAAPMTAEQLAAQAREEQSAQRGRRDLELEGEREDAARILEDEFEEMEGLEERVRKLREKRERLRLEGSSDAGAGVAAGVRAEALDSAEGNRTKDQEAASSDEDDDDEDVDEWKFGGS